VKTYGHSQHLTIRADKIFQRDSGVFKQFHQMLGATNANLPAWLSAVLEPIWPTDGEQRAWELLGFSFHLVTQDLQSFWKS